MSTPITFISRTALTRITIRLPRTLSLSRPARQIREVLNSRVISCWVMDSSLYLNGSKGSAKYAEGPNFPNGGLWVANTPRDIEGIAVFWQQRNWDVGVINKRVGKMYNDNGTLTYLINGQKLPYPVDQAISIDPFDLTNVFVNYTIKNTSYLRGTKIQFAVNNLFNSHNVVGVTPAMRPPRTVPFVRERRRSVESSPRAQLFDHHDRRLRAEAVNQLAADETCLSLRDNSRRG